MRKIIDRYLIATVSCSDNYRHMGCYSYKVDAQFLESLEVDANIDKRKSCAHLDGDYRNRLDPINKCYLCAKEKGFNLFVLQNGGECLVDITASFNEHEISSACENKKGGLVGIEYDPTDVYIIKGICKN